MTGTRRQWLQAAALWPACLALQAGDEFWDTKDPAKWSNDEKQALLGQSPWAREGFVRLELEKKKGPGYGSDGRLVTGPPPVKPGVPAEGVRSVPIGEPVPPVPDGDLNHVQFRVLARWESAKPVRLAGVPEMPELFAQYYAIRLRGLPLMPPPKAKPGETAAPNPNEGMLQAIKVGSRLERKNKAAIPCARLFSGSGDEATQVLLFFSRAGDPITAADKLVTLESRFAQFHLSIKFPLMDMRYKSELAL